MHAQRSIPVLSITLLLTILIASHIQAAKVELSWTAPAEDAAGDTLTDLAGYNVYYGLSSRSYTDSVDVGLTTSAVISDLQDGRTYYFAVTAYDRAGNESGFSDEVARTLSAADTDGDGLPDVDETDIYQTNPTKADSDGDGIADGAEMAFWGTDWKADADDDGVINLLDRDSDNDSFSDGLERSRGSDPADAQSVPSGGSTVLFADDFQRADSGTVGNGWVEVETDSRTRIANGRLVFDAANDAFRPQIRHTFPAQGSGDLVWTFNLNFQRTGPEYYYSFWMQLGQGSLMSNSDPTERGVGVNLIWGSPTHGLTTHEGLGYVVDGEVTQLARVSGGNVAITVAVDLDRQTYSVSVGGQQVGNIPFTEPISAIDTVRFFAHELDRVNFTLREIDSMVVR